ncbi:MAG: phosphoribosylanthranilate isomerase [Oceanococcus sp.]
MSHRTRIKICGLSRPQDLQQAIDLGVDSVGLVFFSKSPRHLEIDQATALMAQIPAFVSAVALFLDPEADYVEQVLNRVKPDVLQFHGQENAEFCEQFGRRYVKAVAMQQQGDPLEQARKDYPNASGYLVDSHEPGGMGGRGLAFDWSRLSAQQARLILAGGLNPSNVQKAIEQLRPAAVDVSSGVEDSPGCKSAAKMTGFVAAVRAADSA